MGNTGTNIEEVKWREVWWTELLWLRTGSSNWFLWVTTPLICLIGPQRVSFVFT